MSTTLTRGKRTLAGIAAGALGLALVPFVGAGVASAATVSSVTAPTAVRGGVAVTAGVNEGFRFAGADLTTPGTAQYAMSVLAGPAQFGSLTLAGGSTAPQSATLLRNTADVTFPVQATGVTYTVGLYQCAAGAVDDVGATVGSGVICAGAETATLVGSFNQAVGAGIATLSLAPANASIPNTAGVTQLYTVTAADASGRATLVTAGDTVTLTSSNTGVATIPTSLTVNTGTGSMVATASRVGAGTTVISAIPTNVSVTTQTATLNVVPSGATSTSTSVVLTGGNLVNVTTAGVHDTAFTANLNKLTLPFAISGLAANATYGYTATPAGDLDIGSGVNTAVTSTFTADAAGNASITLVPVAGVANNASVTFVVAGSSGVVGPLANDSKRSTVTYSTPLVAFQSPSQNSTLYAQASSTVSVPVELTDQYGNPSAGATVRITQVGQATPVASGTTNLEGKVTLTFAAPASGSVSYQLTGLLADGVTVPSPINFAVSVGSPSVAVTSGLVTASLTTAVNVTTPSELATITNPANTTPVVISVSEGGTGITGADVVFTGSDGVHFVRNAAPSGQAWNTGVTQVAKPTAAGTVTVWAYSITSGTNTVTATVGGVVVTGTFVSTSVPASARNVAVTAPAQISAGGTAIATVTITDNFGNVVPAGQTTLRMANTSPGFFGGGSRSVDLTTDSQGQAQVVVAAGANEMGTIQFLSSATGSQYGAAANRLQSTSTTDNAPGFTASNAPVTTSILISGSAGMSIMIEGTRGENEDSNRVYVEGTTTGLVGETVTPYYRFPGQVGFNRGVGLRTVDSLGNFAWKRITGKRVGVQFRYGDIRSNSLIIEAR